MTHAVFLPDIGDGQLLVLSFADGHAVAAAAREIEADGHLIVRGSLNVEPNGSGVVKAGSTKGFGLRELVIVAGAQNSISFGVDSRTAKVMLTDEQLRDVIENMLVLSQYEKGHQYVELDDDSVEFSISLNEGY